MESLTDFFHQIKDFLNPKLLIDCLPGETIEVIRIAPLGDPIAISIAGYMLGLRKDEASTIRVKMKD